MNVLSLFDGMSIGRIALEKAGIKVDKYYASEIKPHAIEVTQKNYPNNIQLGDITNWKDWNLTFKSIDLVIGGSPCQNLSGANKERLGLEGIKSKLFYTYVDILNHIRSLNPDVKFLLENVKMPNNDKDIISMNMGVQPININSSTISGQLRNRLYWTNIPNVEQPADKEVLLQDILEYGYTDREKSRCLLESDSRPLSTPVKMFHRYYSTGFTTLIFKSREHYLACKEHYDENFKGLAAKDIVCDTDVYDGVRYLSKIELERLQTVPCGYTDILKRNDAACLLGDGWTVDVIAHIFKGLKL